MCLFFKKPPNIVYCGNRYPLEEDFIHFDYNVDNSFNAPALAYAFFLMRLIAMLMLMLNSFTASIPMITVPSSTTGRVHNYS